jgi:hypothetical protein
MVRALASVADQQVTCADACADQLLARQAQDAVRAPGDGCPWRNRSVRYAAPPALNPGGTKPALQTPMPPSMAGAWLVITRTSPAHSMASTVVSAWLPAVTRSLNPALVD